MQVYFKNGELYIAVHPKEKSVAEHIVQRFGGKKENITIIKGGRVIPAHRFIRILFYVFRFLGFVEFTRSWKCQWVVEFNGKVYGPFHDRRKAIRFEEFKLINKIKGEN